MNVTVIGGAGFIGSHLVDRLMAENHDVTVVDDFSNGHLGNIKNFSALDECDVTNPDFDVKKYDPDTVYYLACWPRSRSFTNPYRDVEINTAAVARIANQCADSVHLVFASNSGIYDTGHLPINESTLDNPTTPYDVDKLASEHHLRVYGEAYKLRYTIFRFATCYGPRQRCGAEWKPVVSEFCQRLLDGKPPIINGDGNQSRDLIYVGDLVDALVRALDCEKAVGKTMILGTGIETTINEIYDAAVQATSIKLDPLHGERAKGDIDRMRYDCRYAQHTLGWKPETNLREGILKTVQWMRDDE